MAVSQMQKLSLILPKDELGQSPTKRYSLRQKSRFMT